MAQGTRARNGAPLRTAMQVLSSCTDECIIWPHAKTTAGYGTMTVSGRAWYAHVFVCVQTHGPRPTPAHREVAHSCGVPGCINPSHLRWATCAENNADKELHGTKRWGTQVWASRLNEDQVRRIRQGLAVGRTGASLAAEFGVKPMAISQIRNRKTWAWLDRDEVC